MTINFNDPVKQEIWATLRSLNDAWTKGNPDDLAKYFHRDMVAITATDRNRLDGAAACIAGWKGFASAARIHRWEEIDPVIHVYPGKSNRRFTMNNSLKIKIPRFVRDDNAPVISTKGRNLALFLHSLG